MSMIHRYDYHFVLKKNYEIIIYILYIIYLRLYVCESDHQNRTELCCQEVKKNVGSLEEGCCWQKLEFS